MKRCLQAMNMLAILFLTALPVFSADSEESTINIKLSGANPASTGSHVSQSKVSSYYIAQASQAGTRLATPPKPIAYYRSIYPGIDLTCYGDEYRLEYVFTVAPGADPALIRLMFLGIQSVSMANTGGMRIIIPGGEVIQRAPAVFLESGNSLRRVDGMYEMGYGGIVSINPGSTFAKKKSSINNTIFNLVPGGGQPGGPGYNFYLSKYEVSNDQFLKFLNDAEANKTSPRGSNIFFDKLGNMWINQRMKRGSDELFDIAASEISYDPEKPLGERYSHRRNREKNTPFVSHPVTGVSWFGAVKYCNWLTIEAGRSPAECCYTEGTNTTDWAPVTATNWANGKFGDAERQAWLSFKGFRLPMIGSAAGIVTTNAFGEFYKAAAWDAVTNRLFGYGRDSFEGTEANYRNTIAKTNQHTFPVGYFNGNEYLGKWRTRPNENFYGIFDLSGNVAEWMNDFGTNGLPAVRTVCGGSWEDAPTPLTAGKIVPADSTSSLGGFRSTTTYLPIEGLRIHILFNFFLEDPLAEALAAENWPWLIPPSPEAAISPAAEAPGTPYEYGGPEVMSIGPNGIAYKPAIPGVPPTEVTRPGEPGEEPESPEIRPPHGGGGGGSTNVVPTTNYTVSIIYSPPGTVASISVNTPDNGGNLSGNSFTYRSGTWVTLTAPANAGGLNFQQWMLGAAVLTVTRDITIQMTGNITLTAVYVTPPIQYTLTVLSSPSGGVPIAVGAQTITTAGSALYNEGTSLIAVAPAMAGANTFQKWQVDGRDVTTSRSLPITMDMNHTIRAVYVYIPGPIDPPPISPGGV